jgi:hypothetical protein
MKIPVGSNTTKDVTPLVATVTARIRSKRGEAEKVLQQSIPISHRDDGAEGN